MPTDSHSDQESFLLPTEMPRYGMLNTNEQQPNTTPPITSFVQPIPAHQLQAGSVSPHPPTLQVVFFLLLTICLGSLGAFSLTPYLLPDTSSSSAIISSRPAPKLIPTVAPLTPTPFTDPFLEGECTATPRDMKYLPSTQGQTDAQSLPAAWSQAGRTQRDFAYAQACAASFVITYQTFDSDYLKTLGASTYMFTNGAKQRFNSDHHMDPMWRASLQKQHHQQTAQAATPGLFATRYTNGRLLVWIVVPYRTSIQIDNSPHIVQDAQFTVLLVAVPTNIQIQKTGTGWQVSQWVDGSVLFEPPDPL
jgi:hypothetical protein